MGRHGQRTANVSRETFASSVSLFCCLTPSLSLFTGLTLEKLSYILGISQKQSGIVALRCESHAL